MIKSEVVKKDGKFADVEVTVEDTSAELLAEISSILESFDKRPELALILVKAMDKLVKKLWRKNNGSRHHILYQ